MIRKKKEQAAQEKLEHVSDEEGKEVDGKDVEEPEEEVEVIKEVIGDTKEKCEDCPEPEPECCKESCSEPEPECCKGSCSEPEPELKTDPELEGGKLDEDLTKSLNDVDPWMANKLKD